MSKFKQQHTAFQKAAEPFGCTVNPPLRLGSGHLAWIITHGSEQRRIHTAATTSDKARAYKNQLARLRRACRELTEGAPSGRSTKESPT